LIRVGEFPAGDFTLALGVAIAVQAGALALLKTSGGTPLRADISDEKVRPIAVAITPVPDEEAPLLKLGSKRQPNKLPDRWQAPKPVERAKAAATPSPLAQATPEAIPTTQVTDAGPPPPDAEVTKQADLTVAVPDAGTPAVSNTEGAADGVKEGTEADPLKAHAISLYRAQLDGWFSSRFAIRGKIPFETLKTLRASVSVSITDGRTIGSFRIASPSGNPVFDEQLRATLAGIQSSGAELPPPPPLYPDILGQSLHLSFSCTTKRLCE
jgi:hypothetical protein